MAEGYRLLAKRNIRRQRVDVFHSLRSCNHMEGVLQIFHRKRLRQTLFDTSKKTTQTYLRVLKKDYAAKFGYTNDDTKVYLETGMILGDSSYYIALTFKFKGDEMNPDIVKDFIKLIDSAIGENVVIEESDDEEIVISEDD